MSPQVVLASMPSSEPTAKGQTDENQAGVGGGGLVPCRSRCGERVEETQLLAQPLKDKLDFFRFTEREVHQPRRP